MDNVDNMKNRIDPFLLVITLIILVWAVKAHGQEQQNEFIQGYPDGVFAPHSLDDLMGDYLFPEIPEDPRFALDQILVETHFQQAIQQNIATLEVFIPALKEDDVLCQAAEQEIEKLKQYEVHGKSLEQLQKETAQLRFAQQLNVHLPFRLRVRPELEEETQQIMKVVGQFLANEISVKQMQTEWQAYLAATKTSTQQAPSNSAARESQRRSDVRPNEPEQAEANTKGIAEVPIWLFTGLICYSLFLTVILATQHCARR